MTIYDYQQPHVRLRTIGYSSREHNKAVVSLRELMPVSRVVHLEKKTNSYGDVYCNVVLYFDEIGVGIDIGHASNSLAITEAEEGSLEGTNGIIRARTLPGRTFGASVKFDF